MRRYRIFGRSGAQNASAVHVYVAIPTTVASNGPRDARVVRLGEIDLVIPINVAFQAYPVGRPVQIEKKVSKLIDFKS